MDRPLLLKWIPPCILFSALLTTRFATAAPNDVVAQKLCDLAIDHDYAAKDFAGAEKKLNSAVALCNKTSDCSPFMRARVHCDLGVVELALHKVDLARTEFATALIEDPQVALDSRLSSADAVREFDAVKNAGSPAGPPAGPPSAAPPPSMSAPDQGGMPHTPPVGQAVRTPLPLYVEVPPDLGVVKVTLRYKPIGAKDWETAAMRPVPGGYGVEIPCDRVGDQEGNLEYFFQAHDALGDLVAASGSSTHPYHVAIVKKLEGEPPHLPGQAPPSACPSASAAPEAPSTTVIESADCPPGLPGCHTEEAKSCESRDDCMAGEECVDKTCQHVSEDERRPYKKNWLSLGVQAELLFMPGADDACLGGTHYTCFQPNGGSYYAGIPAAGHDDKVLAGFSVGPMMRILVGYDRAVLPNVTIGARLGYAVSGGGPQRPANGAAPAGPSFMPLHVEVRVAYWFGKNVLARAGWRFYAVVAGGMTEVDASTPIDVFATAASTTQINLDAWTKTGLGFGAVGPGVMYAVTPSSGLLLETKAIGLVPTLGFAVAAQLGYAIGF